MFKSIKDFNLENKRVLLRCSFNVPVNKQGLIFDNFRIKKALPTIEYLVKKKAKIILMSHFGRPGGNINLKYSLKPVAKELEKLLGKEIKFLNDCIGKEVEKEIEKMKAGDIILLENLRFYKEEKENNEKFAKNLAELGDIFIQDAFAVCHRKHASTVGIPKYLPSAAGLLLEKEIKTLSMVFKKPECPLVAIMGGAKIQTKIKLIERFLEKADHLLLGGKLANIILRAKGISSADLFSDTKTLKKVKNIDLTNSKLHLPIDGIISLAGINGSKEDYIRETAIGTVKKEENIYDIGSETIKIFSEIIKPAKMIVWNGPLGMSEKKEFERGTKKIAEAIAENSSAFKIAGGGSTISALNKFGLINKFDHVSTGGGSMLSFLSGEKLPGVAILENNQ